MIIRVLRIKGKQERRAEAERMGGFSQDAPKVSKRLVKTTIVSSLITVGAWLLAVLVAIAL